MTDKNELSEYELLRLKNIEENLQMMKELGILSTPNSTPSLPIRRTRLRKYSESSFESSLPRSRRSSESSLLSSQRRRSKRLASMNPVEVQFTEDVARTILGDVNSCQVSLDDEDDNNHEYDFDDNDDFDIDKENTKRRKIHPRHQKSGPREIPSVEEITADDLKRVCEIVSEKVYSQDGTTCHQCRQKTLDQKTYCRSKECFGVRGQFCGPCLKNRYGESVVQALKDPEWHCPPCRGLCNCSICRTQQGKIPTGQLYHLAQERGYKSVRHFLEKEVETEDDN